MRSGSVLPCLAASLALFLAACSDDPSGSSQSQAQGKPAPEAGFVTVQGRAITLSRQLPGRTAAHRVAQVRPQVGGVIEKRLFKEGQKVEAGEPLYKIDSRVYQANLASARAELARAKATLESNRLQAERFKKLLDLQSVSQQEYDQAQAKLAENKAAVAAAQASVQSAKINLDYATIEAPIDGRIGRSSVTAGALVTANQPQTLATIRQLDPIYVDVSQSSNELRELRKALNNGDLKQLNDDQAKVKLLLEDGTEYGHNGTLQFSEFAVEESTGSVTLRALFPNPEGDLLPGLFVRAKLPEGTRNNAILVPQKGITRDPTGQAFAMILDGDDTVKKVEVTTERALGNRWLIRDGLQDGDRLVIDGLQNIKPGATVKPVATDAEPATNAEVAQSNAAQ